MDTALYDAPQSGLPSPTPYICLLRGTQTPAELLIRQAAPIIRLARRPTQTCACFYVLPLLPSTAPSLATTSMTALSLLPRKAVRVRDLQCLTLL